MYLVIFSLIIGSFNKQRNYSLMRNIHINQNHYFTLVMCNTCVNNWSSPKNEKPKSCIPSYLETFGAYRVYRLLWGFWVISGSQMHPLIIICFHCTAKSSVNILLNMSFCVPQKKVSHTVLEQHEGEYMTIYMSRKSKQLILQSTPLT